MGRLWKNWPVHNLVAHPLSEIAYWILGSKWSEWIHDSSIPPAEAPHAD